MNWNISAEILFSLIILLLWIILLKMISCWNDATHAYHVHTGHRQPCWVAEWRPRGGVTWLVRRWAKTTLHCQSSHHGPRCADPRWIHKVNVIDMCKSIHTNWLIAVALTARLRLQRLTCSDRLQMPGVLSSRRSISQAAISFSSSISSVCWLRDGESGWY